MHANEFGALGLRTGTAVRTVSTLTSAIALMMIAWGSNGSGFAVLGLSRPFIDGGASALPGVTFAITNLLRLVR